MNSIDYLLNKIATLQKIDIFCMEKDMIKDFGKTRDINPLITNKLLQAKVMCGAKSQNKPFIYCDEFSVCFAGIQIDNLFYLVGPMCLLELEGAALYRYYRKYEIEILTKKRLKHFSFSEMLEITELLAFIILGISYTNQELTSANHLVEDTKEKIESDQVLYEIKEEEEALYHHTYQEERKLLDSVRAGQIKDAITYSNGMDMELGKLSENEINHWKNGAIAAITLCTRAAIEGGELPSVAYRLSDFYIQKCDQCRDVAQIIAYRNNAVEDLTKCVLKRKDNQRTSNYVERSKDYVEKHYREKIYIDDIAQVLHITPSYLSKLFHRETGIRLQDYIVYRRLGHAANLLKYSEESIARIAEYVNFPSQSYFGKAFKTRYHVSPKEYRNLNRPAEF